MSHGERFNHVVTLDTVLTAKGHNFPVRERKIEAALLQTVRRDSFLPIKRLHLKSLREQKYEQFDPFSPRLVRERVENSKSLFKRLVNDRGA